MLHRSFKIKLEHLEVYHRVLSTRWYPTNWENDYFQESFGPQTAFRKWWHTRYSFSFSGKNRKSARGDYPINRMKLNISSCLSQMYLSSLVKKYIKKTTVYRGKIVSLRRWTIKEFMSGLQTKAKGNEKLKALQKIFVKSNNFRPDGCFWWICVTDLEQAFVVRDRIPVPPPSQIQLLDLLEFFISKIYFWHVPPPPLTVPRPQIQVSSLLDFFYLKIIFDMFMVFNTCMMRETPELFEVDF